MPFEKGQSGNPSGRREGSRNKATLALEALLDGEAERLTRKAIELALSGEGVALRLCLDRILPPRKDRLVVIDLPKLEKTEDFPKVMSAVTEAVAQGNITPGEAEILSRIMEAQRKNIETADLEKRLTELEEKVLKH